MRLMPSPATPLSTGNGARFARCRSLLRGSYCTDSPAVCEYNEAWWSISCSTVLTCIASAWTIPQTCAGPCLPAPPLRRRRLVQLRDCLRRRISLGMYTGTWLPEHAPQVGRHLPARATRVHVRSAHDVLRKRRLDAESKRPVRLASESAIVLCQPGQRAASDRTPPGRSRHVM